MNKRLPSQTCAFCNKTISDIGGKRIILNTRIGVLIGSEESFLAQKDNITKKISLDDSCSIGFVHDLWNEETIERARKQASEGTHPWVCQICGKRACPKCGGPAIIPIASELIYDNGDTAYCAVLPAGDLTCSKCRQ